MKVCSFVRLLDGSDMHCYIDKPLSRATSVLAPHGWLRSIDSGINFCKSSRHLRRQVHLANQHHCCSVGGCPPLILPLSGFSSATCTSGDQFIRLPSSSISREGSLVSMGRFSIRGRRSPPYTVAFIYAPFPCLIIPFFDHHALLFPCFPCFIVTPLLYPCFGLWV